MSAVPAQKGDDFVNLEINGQPIKAPKGSMIIQAADLARIAIPRFCYHKKLTIHANCRVCMVEVEMNGRAAPKPLPSCATPVSEGMKVYTKSEKAMSAQRNGLEFILINHPLDCPVCDQGGECELQDLALGFGRSVSRFTERKRVVADENVGPLIATYMTRCIHCMRCVRFLREIAGTNELGGMDRGDRMKIGTYIGRSIESELSGNIIDLCPVGALTDKPFQFRARAWEVVAKPSIGYHDAMGSNMWLHTRRGEVLRVVPRDNDAINECWLADRDRYSYQGMYAEDRLQRPRIKRGGHWQDCDWDQALNAVMTILKGAQADDLGVLVHPSTTCEEGVLLKRMADALGVPHIDHRLRQLDFADNGAATPFGIPIAAFELLDAALIVGSDTRSEMPLLHGRLRQASLGFRKHAKAANRNRFDITREPGAALHVLNPVGFGINYDLASETIVAPQRLVDRMLGLAAAVVAAKPDVEVPEGLREAIAAAKPDATAQAAVKDLVAAESGVVFLGEVGAQHPQASWLRACARFVAQATGCAYAEMPCGANAVGLAQYGVLPGRDGLNAHAMLERPRKDYILYGVEPPDDFADGKLALSALGGAEHVIAFTAYASPALLDVADVIVPLALMPETEATLINCEGVAQSYNQGSRPPGDVRSGWKALRALGGLMQLEGFTFTNMDQLRDSMQLGPALESTSGLAPRVAGAAADDLVRLATTPIYRGDSVLRRAKALNEHPLTRIPCARLNVADASRLGLADGDKAKIPDAELPVVIDSDVPAGCVWIESCFPATAVLPAYGSSLHLTKA